MKVIKLRYRYFICFVSFFFLWSAIGVLANEGHSGSSTLAGSIKHLSSHAKPNIGYKTSDAKLSLQKEHSHNSSKKRVLNVGPNRMYSMPSVAAKFSHDGDTIEIDARGDYTNDEVIWKNNDLVIRGVNGQPNITSNRLISNRKALWVIKGNNIKIENIEFSNARVRSRNGAGIRLEGTNLTISGCYFHDNENGILAGRNPKSTVTIKYSEFSNNGAGRGKTHNIYIGPIKELNLRFNNIHHAKIGHNIKTRAEKNLIFYNRIMDEHDGRASYQVDISNGGESILVGNVIQQGPRAENSSIIAYGVEGIKYERNKLILVNNTIVNDRHTGQFFNFKKRVSTYIFNNIFAGKGKILINKNELINNTVTTRPRFLNQSIYDYHLAPDSEAIDKGKMPADYANASLQPQYEYTHTAGKKRMIKGAIDHGAFEHKN